jgi:hypothetical protein
VIGYFFLIFSAELVSDILLQVLTYDTQNYSRHGI